MKAQPSTIFRSLYSSCVYAVHIKLNAADTVMHFYMREVIMHAQPSSGSMHLIFGPYVRPNGACLSRLLHIVDNFICLC